MAKIPIFTSIPPRFVRLDNTGTDIGTNYLSRCVHSWRDNNFEPMSINADIERQPEILNDLAIRRINVGRNAQELCGKPLVYLSDFVRSACEIANGPVAITNSDILLDISSETLEKFNKIKPGQCFVAPRIDISSIESREGREYRYGYDFFVYHSQDLDKLMESQFVFGLPWWDHFLPVVMYSQGVRQIGADRMFAYHLLHNERWDWQLWIHLGRQYVDLMLNKSDYKEGEYIRNLRHAVNGYDQDLLNLLKIRIKRLTPSGREKDNIQALYRVARHNWIWCMRRIEGGHEALTL